MSTFRYGWKPDNLIKEKLTNTPNTEGMFINTERQDELIFEKLTYEHHRRPITVSRSQKFLTETLNGIINGDVSYQVFCELFITNLLTSLFT